MDGQEREDYPYKGKHDPLRDLRATPRSCKEAFGSNMEKPPEGFPLWVRLIILAVLFFVVAL